MTKLRAWAAGLILVLVLGAIMAAWFGSRGARVDVRLVYLTHTAPHAAIFLITNAGSCPVKINERITIFSTNGPGSSCMTPTPGFPTVLAPGQSLRVEAEDILSAYLWQARMTYLARGMRDRIAAAVWTSSNTLMRKFGRSLFAAPRNVTVISDCVTNLAMERLRLTGFGDPAFWQRNGIPGAPSPSAAPNPVFVTNPPPRVLSNLTPPVHSK